MNRCIKAVVNSNCHHCLGPTIKFGKIRNQQRYRCKSCNKTQVSHYLKRAYKPITNSLIINHVTEGSGIRSIARLLNISPNTVIRRIKIIASNIKKPPIATGKIYEVDELKTYIKRKTRDCWVTYALDQQTGQVVDLKVGSRNQSSLKRVIDTLLLSNCKQIYTDGWRVYRQIIPPKIHKVKRYGTNRIERKNLSLRTHLKRLNRKTICFSKSIIMLEACLKIYFWHKLIPGVIHVRA
ncbi:MAG TPA: IS1 family transposase [Mucilaginibacter sp.]|jgi:IS1 family transposase/transposase-like protein|nr:IS1 family transposase [Mucilaginibacter sp.]